MQIRAYWQLGLILLIYLILATAYSMVVPIGRGADEWAHYWYAQFIAENGRLPTSPAEREAAGYKSDWPPLYHLAAASLTFWIDTEGPPTFKYRADNIRYQLVPAQGPEAILHTEDERFPWQQEILIWHLGRFLSITFSLGTLVVTYFVALEWFTAVGNSEPKNNTTTSAYSSETARQKIDLPAPQLPTPPTTQSPISSLQSHNYQLSIINYQLLALLTVTILAFNPRFLFTGMLFNYDSLTLLLSSLFLWLGVRVVKGCDVKWGFWGLGALAGLALVTKYLAALLPLIIIFLAFAKKNSTKQTPQPILRNSQLEDQDSEPTTLPMPHTPRSTSHTPRPTSYVPRSTSQLLSALLTFTLITSWWFGYLIITFNEIETYGPVLGTLAPLIRGDGSDRTVEGIFAWLSGGQAPAPDYIDKQNHTVWQIMSELPLTFWGNPIIEPYPLNWFVTVMSIFTLTAVMGLIIEWQKAAATNRLLLNLLLLFCALPLPFMLIRLFGARDALEAVQGRHILFLSGPAFAILFVYGLQSIANFALRIGRGTWNVGRRLYLVVLAVLLVGAVAQLIFMVQTYPPLLPVRTTEYETTQTKLLDQSIVLENGAKLVDFSISDESQQSLYIELIWQGGADWAVEDYQMELGLIDTQSQIQATWLGYQTQARYPTRAWEAGDTIRDEGWLPLVGLPAGDYQIRLRILGVSGPITAWHTLGSYTLSQTLLPPATTANWLIWHNGQITTHPPLLHERETVQLTPTNYQLPITQLLNLQSPISHLQSPISPTFTIPPHWPAGDYSLTSDPQTTIFRVAPSRRNFEWPDISHPLDVNFENEIKLLGYDLPSRRVEPGGGLPITLYWQGLAWTGQEFVIFNRLLDNQQLAWGGYDRMAQENYSTLLWAPQEIIVDGFAVPVAPGAPDGVYYLSVGWYRSVAGEAQSLPLVDPETGAILDSTAVMLGPIKVGGPPPGVTVEQIQPQIENNVVLGGQIKLLGVDLFYKTSRQNPQFANPEQPSLATPTFTTTASLDLALYWEPVDLPKTDYTVFIHLRNQTGETVAQKDSPPLNGDYPTSLWEPGEIIKDEVHLSFDSLESGVYEAVVGLYDFSTGTRLHVAESLDNTILLGEFEVVAE